MRHWENSMSASPPPNSPNLPFRARYENITTPGRQRGWFGKLFLLFLAWRCRWSRAALGRSPFAPTALVLTVNPGVFLLHQFFQLCLQTCKGRANGWKRGSIIVFSCLNGNTTARSQVAFLLEGTRRSSWWEINEVENWMRKGLIKKQQNALKCDLAFNKLTSV